MRRTACSVLVSLDPLSSLGIGSKVVFRTLKFSGAFGEKVPSPLRDTGLYHGIILAVGIRNLKVCRIVGTAVMIGPGLVVTAWHVIEEWLPKLKNSTEEMILMGQRGNQLDLWIVRSIAFSSDDDIAYLSLEPRSALPDGGIYNKFGLRIDPPKAGDMVTVIGYRFELACGALGGMSGGPVLDNVGRVIGVLA